MSSRELTARFQSPIAPVMGQFVQQKQACGYKYGEAARLLVRFDRFLCDEALSQCELPRSISRKWLAKQRHESSSTHRNRVVVVRQLAIYMCQLGYCAGARSIADCEVQQCQFLATHPDTRRGSRAPSRGRSTHADCARAAAPPHHARSLPTTVWLRLPARRGAASARGRC